jgi:peptidoglycan/xylan/chitin deacetylase (PgdA/CDA1 family)
VALTYDDGPAAITPRFLATLRRLGVPATFFMLGQQVAASPAITRQVMADGHELANHSWNHANLGGGGPAASAQLEHTNAVIRRVTGFTPCLFRPPGGSTGADLVARVRALGMTSVLWSADPFDWRLPGTSAIVGRVLAQTGRGGIILDHDGGGPREQTLAAAPAIIAALRARGYTFVTVSALLGYRERIALER